MYHFFCTLMDSDLLEFLKKYAQERYSNVNAILTQLVLWLKEKIEQGNSDDRLFINYYAKQSSTHQIES